MLCSILPLCKLTIIINDFHSCTVSNILSSTLNTRNQERIVRSESQYDCVIVLQSDRIIGCEQMDFCTVLKLNGLQLFEIRTAYKERQCKNLIIYTFKNNYTHTNRLQKALTYSFVQFTIDSLDSSIVLAPTFSCF